MRTAAQRREYDRAYQRENRALHRRVGLCVRCKRDAESGYRLCAVHLVYFRARQAAYRDRRRAEGRCYFCTQAVVAGTTLCAWHHEYHRAHRRRRPGQEAAA